MLGYKLRLKLGDKGKGLNPTNDYHVLNPSWMANGMYRLILRTPPDVGFIPHKKIKEALGQIYSDDVSNRKYSRQEADFILHVMRKFEISLQAEEGVEMIPMKMPKTPSDSAYRFPREDALHLCWKASYLPNNLIHRLVIRKYRELDPDLKREDAVWRDGGRFYQRTYGCRALADMNEQELHIYVSGVLAERRQYMESFRTEVLYILEALNIKAREVICFITKKGRRGELAYRDVMTQYRRAPSQEMLVPGTDEYISPSYLLGETYYDLDAKVREQEAQSTEKRSDDADSSEENRKAEAHEAEMRKMDAETRRTNAEIWMLYFKMAAPSVFVLLILILFAAGAIEIETLIDFLKSLLGSGG